MSGKKKVEKSPDPLDEFIDLIKNQKESAESKKLPYGEQADTDFHHEFNEFHALDRVVVKRILTTELGDLEVLHENLIKEEVDHLFIKHQEFIDFLAMIVILASKDLKVSRYAILKATEDIIQGNY